MTRDGERREALYIRKRTYGPGLLAADVRVYISCPLSMLVLIARSSVQRVAANAAPPGREQRPGTEQCHDGQHAGKLGGYKMHQ